MAFLENIGKSLYDKNGTKSNLKTLLLLQETTLEAKNWPKCSAPWSSQTLLRNFGNFSFSAKNSHFRAENINFCQFCAIFSAKNAKLQTFPSNVCEHRGNGNRDQILASEVNLSRSSRFEIQASTHTISSVWWINSTHNISSCVALRVGTTAPAYQCALYHMGDLKRIF